MILLIGGHGFVGSAFARLFATRSLPFKIVTRDNADELAGSECDVLLNANGNSRKFMADREPLWEFDASVRSVAETIARFKPRLYVHLSTGDVYPDQSSPEITQEDQQIDVSRLSRYGLHKYLAEQLVQNTQDNWLIFRMGGFVGPGLKKNAIFDMLTNAPLWLAPESELQFISTDRSAEIVWSIAQSQTRNEIINLGAKGVVQIGDLYRELGSRSDLQQDAKKVRFELNLDKLARLSPVALPETRREVLDFARGGSLLSTSV